MNNYWFKFYKETTYLKILEKWKIDRLKILDNMSTKDLYESCYEYES